MLTFALRKYKFVVADEHFAQMSSESNIGEDLGAVPSSSALSNEAEMCAEWSHIVLTFGLHCDFWIALWLRNVSESPNAQEHVQIPRLRNVLEGPNAQGHEASKFRNPRFRNAL